MTDESLREHPVQGAEVFRGNFLRVRRDTVQLPDGTRTEREYVLHPGAVVIIPVLGEAGDAAGCRVILERQYRYPMRQVIVEFPAGKLDPGEQALACAQRELREETGYRAAEWARAGQMHPLVAYSDEAIDIWLARGLEAGPRQLDHGEFLQVIETSCAQLMAWCRNGTVTDAKTLIGAFWLQQWFGGQWQPQWQPAGAQAP
ncbi:MAG: NUDIX hydrolase [Burkholderiaceae bacterium]|jgi:ADP-ribose pyrophosphatase|nr:NUDIX hydrolase [Burkholderiaceae bacterium]